MKFTKENVELAFDEFMHGSDSIADLKENIMNLVDEPEKVVVPKFVAEWLAFKKTNKDSLHVAIDGDWQIMPKAMKDWLLIEFNDEVFARAWLDGYTIEKEPLYEVVIHETEDDRLLLVALEDGDYKFEFESDNEGLWKQHHTESEIKKMDKRYWPFAVPVEESK